MAFAAIRNTPLHTHKLNISLITGAITDLAALIKDTSISPAKVAFQTFRDFIIFSTSCGNVGEMKKE